MSELQNMVKAFKPKDYRTYDVSVKDLQTYFYMSYSEASILQVLLREYSAHQGDFNSKAVRQHIYFIRRKLDRIFQSEMIDNIGSGFYLISNENKTFINEYIIAKKMTALELR